MSFQTCMTFFMIFRTQKKISWKIIFKSNYKILNIFFYVPQNKVSDILQLKLNKISQKQSLFWSFKANFLL